MCRERKKLGGEVRTCDGRFILLGDRVGGDEVMKDLVREGASTGDGRDGHLAFEREWQHIGGTGHGSFGVDDDDEGKGRR